MNLSPQPTRITIKAVLLCLFLLPFFTIVQVAAQEDSSWNKVLTLKPGVSVPFNEYADKTFSYHSGFANPGGCLEADFLFYKRWFGLNASLGYSNQTFAKKKYTASYSTVLDNTGITDVSAGIYQSLKAVAGFNFRIINTKKAELFLLAQAGIALNVHPNIEVTNTYWGQINTIVRSADFQSTSVIGVLLKYNLNEEYGMSFSYNANYTLPYFRDDYIMRGGFNLPMRFQNITLGISKKL